MVAPQHDGGRYFALADGLVEGEGNPGAAFAVGVEDTGLGAHDHLVAAGFPDPVDVVPHLAGDFLRGTGGHLSEHLHRQFVGFAEVFGIFAHTHPAERAESVVKVQRTHNVLHVGRVAETAVGLENFGPGTGAFQQEGVSVVEKVHPLVTEPVDGGDMASQGCLDGFFEALGLFGHHPFALFQTVACGVVAAGPGVVEGSLVRAQVHVYALIGQALPQVHHVAHVGQGNHLLGGDGLPDTRDKLVQTVVELVHPALLVALFGSLGIDFGRDAHHAGYVAGLGLGARHSAQACGHEEQPFPGFTVQAFGQQLLAGGIHHRDGGSVHDSLRADIHITSGRHLAVLAYAQGVERSQSSGLE